MGKKLNIKIGTKYGRLIIIEEAKKSLTKRMFRCSCECGGYATVRLNQLVNGMTKSCGCLKKENFLNTPVFVKHGMSGKQFYNIYKGMIGRCERPYTNSYELYGGRGIKCLWKTLEDFKKDMYESYLEHVALYGEKQTSIDRLDNNGNYYKGNCKWATKSQQMKNRRKFTHNKKHK